MHPVIALVGYPCSGKGLTVELLQSRGFNALSLSDILRNIQTSRSGSHIRSSLGKLALELKQTQGPDILARMAVETISNTDTPIVVDGIRHPAELMFLYDNYHAHLVGVEADPHTRFRRMKERARKGDPRNWRQFLKLDASENSRNIDGSPFPTHDVGAQLDTCFELVSQRGFLLNSNGGMGELNTNIGEMMKYFGIEGGKINCENL